MARPTSRNGTKNQTYRKRIPADVRRILATLPESYRPRGWAKDEIVITLGTADGRKAAAEHARISHEVEQRLAVLRAGIRKLSHKEAVALSGRAYQIISGIHEDDPGTALTWTAALDMIEAARDGRIGLEFLAKAQATAANSSAATVIQAMRSQSVGRGENLMSEGDQRRARSLDVLFGYMADGILAGQGLIVDAPSRALLVEQLAKAAEDASRKLARNAEGDYRPDPAAERFPEWKPERPDVTPRDKLTLPALFERWEAHPEQAETAWRTKARYRGVFAAVAEVLKNPDARAVTTDDLQRYVEARMAAEGSAKLKPVAARDVHKAALSSVYGWATGKKLVPGNPAAGVRIKVTKPKRLRPKEATDSETRQLVAAALTIPATAAAGSLEAAKRWCPLIALYTGCRIGEACQLRREDVRTVNGVPLIHITPEAGDVKSGQAREVPIHPRLVELDLLAFVDLAPVGPLFYNAATRRSAKATTPQAELTAGKLAAWARENGLGDPLLLRPLHALRHRFMSLARRAGIEEQYVTAVSGHEPGNMNRQYGTFHPAALHREVAKLRPEDVEGRT